MIQSLIVSTILFLLSLQIKSGQEASKECPCGSIADINKPSADNCLLHCTVCGIPKTFQFQSNADRESFAELVQASIFNGAQAYCLFSQMDAANGFSGRLSATAARLLLYQAGLLDSDPEFDKNPVRPSSRASSTAIATTPSVSSSATAPASQSSSVCSFVAASCSSTSASASVSSLPLNKSQNSESNPAVVVSSPAEIDYPLFLLMFSRLAGTTGADASSWISTQEPDVSLSSTPSKPASLASDESGEIWAGYSADSGVPLEAAESALSQVCVAFSSRISNCLRWSFVSE